MGKLKICELLGVELGEEFEYEIEECGECIWKFIIDDYGSVCLRAKGKKLWSKADSSWALDMLDHPEKIKHKRKFTEQEKADAETLKRLFTAHLIAKDNNGFVFYKKNGELTKKKFLENFLCFPTIKNGESFTVYEIIGDK